MFGALLQRLFPRPPAGQVYTLCRLRDGRLLEVRLVERRAGWAAQLLLAGAVVPTSGSVSQDNVDGRWFQKAASGHLQESWFSADALANVVMNGRAQTEETDGTVRVRGEFDETSPYHSGCYEVDILVDLGAGTALCRQVITIDTGS